MNGATVDPVALGTQYLQLAEEWSSRVDSNPRAANRIFRQLHSTAKQLRNADGGRLQLEKIMEDERPGVQIVAASECLYWKSPRAIEILEAIQQLPSLHAVSAKYTLKGFREGTLDLDS